MILQLNPPLPVTTSKGPGLAFAWLDYGPEHHVIWGVALREGGEPWWVPNPEVRFPANWTMGRRPAEREKKR